MSLKPFLMYLSFLFIFGSIDIIHEYFMKRYCIKKAKFDCSKCKNWRCFKNWCDKQRVKLSVDSVDIPRRG